jgi:hypothetical protein
MIELYTLWLDASTYDQYLPCYGILQVLELVQRLTFIMP